MQYQIVQNQNSAILNNVRRTNAITTIATENGGASNSATSNRATSNILTSKVNNLWQLDIITVVIIYRFTTEQQSAQCCTTNIKLQYKSKN